MMTNPAEREEKKYLARIIAILEEALTRIDANLTKYSKEVKENSYLYENNPRNPNNVIYAACIKIIISITMITQLLPRTFFYPKFAALILT